MGSTVKVPVVGKDGNGNCQILDVDVDQSNDDDDDSSRNPKVKLNKRIDIESTRAAAADCCV